MDADGRMWRRSKNPTQTLPRLGREIGLGQAEAATVKDPDWLINGLWGFIQFADPGPR